jgi:hypothetical protein
MSELNNKVVNIECEVRWQGNGVGIDEGDIKVICDYISQDF